MLNFKVKKIVRLAVSFYRLQIKIAFLIHKIFSTNLNKFFNQRPKTALLYLVIIVLSLFNNLHRGRQCFTTGYSFSFY